MNLAINPQTDYVQTAPVQYKNSSGAIDISGLYIAEWGRKAIVSGGEKAIAALNGRLFASLTKHEVDYHYIPFDGECCDANIEKIVNAARETGADMVIAAGGGKSLDTGKAAAYALHTPIICIPTIAATCAAASALSVVYTDKGEFLRDIYYPRNPELVITEPDIIANAPSEYLSSGILDSLSKWYEGSAAMKSIEHPDIYTQSAITLAKLLKDLLLRDGERALKQVEGKHPGRELTDVIDICIFQTAVIQSLGQASTRGAAAHPIQGGITLIPGSHELLHGHKVAYGIIVQLFMEDVSEKEIDTLVKYFAKLGVKASLKGLGLPNDIGTMRTIAEKANKDPLMKKMPMPVDADCIVEAMIKTEKFVN